MPDSLGQPTPSEVQAGIRTTRAAALTRQKETAIPSDEVAGKMGMLQRAVTAAENTANAAVFTFRNVSTIFAAYAQVRSAAGAVITGDVVVTVSGNSVTVADGGTKQLATGDIISVIIRGE